eukprot:1158322-Pelagomonas_calceolata.AAC.5
MSKAYQPQPHPILYHHTGTPTTHPPRAVAPLPHADLHPAVAAAVAAAAVAPVTPHPHPAAKDQSSLPLPHTDAAYWLEVTRLRLCVRAVPHASRTPSIEPPLGAALLPPPHTPRTPVRPGPWGTAARVLAMCALEAVAVCGAAAAADLTVFCSGGRSAPWGMAGVGVGGLVVPAGCGWS